jgi:hypothetical protein
VPPAPLEPLAEHIAIVNLLFARTKKGWYTGDTRSLMLYGGRWAGPSRSNPRELAISLLLSRDRMHHSVGWWRNAEYEYCWHLSLSCCTMADFKRVELAGGSLVPVSIEMPDEEKRYWSHLIFGEHVNKAWHEPGGTDPRLTREEKLQRRYMFHLRVFLNPLTFRPFIPQGEVYHLTRWIPGLTPDKVDR